MRRHAHDARAGVPSRGGAHRHRRRRRDRGAVLTYFDEPLGRFLKDVAARQPAPGGGAVAGVTVAAAAGLVAMTARFSAALDDADDLA
ncbi:MAG: cyclodeaminase/cyclohydrolase family protein, partial [Egibacteraceae bacterium]